MTLEEYIKLNYEPCELIRAHLVLPPDIVFEKKVAEHVKEVSENYDICAEKESSVKFCLKSAIFPLDEPFAELLLDYMNKKDLESPDVYKACNMTKANFSHQLDPRHKPSKRSVLALCIGLKLNLEESNHFLARAGFSFSSANLQDVIVKYFITESIYDIDVINSALYEHNTPTIP